jgi:hypothetical protein
VLGSFGLSVALSKSAVLAGPALLFPIWGPWMRAGVRNIQVRSLTHVMMPKLGSTAAAQCTAGPMYC